jgi:hypothetical protein
MAFERLIFSSAVGRNQQGDYAHRDIFGCVCWNAESINRE